MSLQRILEPESMDTAEEAQTYDSMDHEEVNRRFVADLLAAVDRQETDFQGSVLDLGTGTALIPIELCRQHATAQIMAIDIAESMLARARIRVADAGLPHRIELQQVDSKSLPFSDQQYDAVVSNSIIHHIPDPQQVIKEAVRVSRRILFFRDLMRPDTGPQLDQLVRQHAGQESEHARSLFRDSLHAALTLEEVRDLVQHFGFPANSVQATSDRHWTWTGIKG